MTDRWTVRAVIVLLGFITVTALAFGGVLAVWEKPIPDFIVATIAGGTGAIGGILAKTSTAPDVDDAALAAMVEQAVARLANGSPEPAVS